MKKTFLLIVLLYLSSKAFPQVGIGTFTPTHDFEVVDSTGDVEIEFRSDTKARLALNALSPLIEWLVSGDKKASITWRNQLEVHVPNAEIDKVPALVITPNKDLGINLAPGQSPSQTLDVNGMIQVSSNNRNPTNGTMRYYKGKFEGYDSGNWKWLENYWRRDVDSNIVYPSGDVGIGVQEPYTTLHIKGGKGNFTTTDGDFRIGEGPNRLYFAIDETQDNGGTARIGVKGSPMNRIIIDANFRNIGAFSDPGFFGIGTITPQHPLHIDSYRSNILANLFSDFSGEEVKYGLKLELDVRGRSDKYGIHNITRANRSYDRNNYGIYSFVDANDSNSNLYGVFGSVSISGRGNKYALYGQAPDAEASWALYADGNAFFRNDVRIGHSRDVPGYPLSVEGKVLCEELKVMLNNFWPDYVFAEDYPLRSPKEIKVFISENGHLPGVPSAAEVQQKGGIEVGEMNRILLEKVEELTLLLIQQNEQIEDQKNRIGKLEKMIGDE